MTKEEAKRIWDDPVELEAFTLDTLDAWDNDPAWDQVYLHWIPADPPPPRTTPRGKGRERGEPRPGDYQEIDWLAFLCAHEDVYRIRHHVWKPFRRGNRLRNRTEWPTAVDIAAKRYGLDQEALISFRKNFSKLNRHHHAISEETFLNLVGTTDR